MTIIKTPKQFGKLHQLDRHLTLLKDTVQQATANGKPAHEVERDIWTQILRLGGATLGCFFKAQGDGNVGKTLTLANGDKVKRLSKRSRPYQSVFGRFELNRYAYGTRESQKIDCFPLDTRLQLPKSHYSYLAQEWGQLMAVELSFDKSMTLLEKILPIHTHVDSLERLNRAQAQDVEAFRASRKAPDAESEASLLVNSADGKGVPIRHEKDERTIEAHQRKRGPKPDRKKMAVVGAVYTVEPFERTAEQVVESLFRDPQTTPKQDTKKRPKPKHKRVVAYLTQEKNGVKHSALASTFKWMAAQVTERNPENKKQQITLMDGQISLWEENNRHFGDKEVVEILDLLHATSRLWDATHLLVCGEGKKIQGKKIQFIKGRVLRLLQGQAKSIVRGFRQMATKQNMKKEKRDKLEKVCRYLENNLSRMQYDQYLQAGYPIASGVIEGACRHYVKDRMERAGMRWTINGAQAMLDLRSIYLNGDWDEYTKYRIQKEKNKLYPQRTIIKKIAWPLAA